MYKKTFRRLLRISCLSLALMGMSLPTADMADVPADSPEIQYFGRWDARDGVRRCGYGATYIKAKFTGTSLKADMEGSGIWWRVSIDGEAFRRLKPQGKATLLGKDLSPGEHKVLLVRSTEGQAGISEFRGFIVDDGAGLTKPDPLKKRRLEFVGDSITAGAINDGIFQGNNYNDVEDNDMSYGPQLARMLHADYSVVAKSGQGVAHNYTETWPLKGVHACDSYDWTFFSNSFSPKNLSWDTEKFPVDAIILSLGTNDFSDPNRKPTAEEFKEGYRKLIAIVRKKNPGKPIICTDPVPSSVNIRGRLWIRQVVEEMSDQGYEKLYFISINENGPLLKPDDFADGTTHPTKEGSKKLAAYLKDKVAAILGWQQENIHGTISPES